MSHFIRNCIYQGKNLFREGSYTFWVILYPIILATFFYAAFGGMMDPSFEDLKVGVEENSGITHVLEEIDFINIYEVSKDELVQKFENDEIDAFVDDNLNLTVNKSGINQTIIKEVVEQIKQTIKLNRPIDGSEFSVSYVLGRDQESNSLTVIFYSLIAMVSTYGVFAGVETASLIQANLSNIAIRINSTPLKKQNFLIAGVMVSLLLNLFANAALLLFINYILKIHLFNNIKYSTIIILLGNLFGVILGIFIGVSNKKSSTKTLMAIAITLLLSFFSGMMGPWIKVMIDKHVPFLSRVNPISIMSNNLYRINFLGSTKSLGEGVIILIGYCIMLLFASYLFLRRKSYDSI
ncbi:MAG: ABC transporter permease [Tissierellia bacterium]|nr:ABC transporter permease [Tissierellia bacterium]